MSRREYDRILASLRAVGLIKPLVVYPDGDEYVILDGVQRYRALLEMGVEVVPCLVGGQREAFTGNRMVNRVSPIQERRMIERSLEELDPAAIGAALGIAHIGYRLKGTLLKRLHPDVAAAFDQGQLTRACATELTHVKPQRQREPAGEGGTPWASGRGSTSSARSCGGTPPGCRWCRSAPTAGFAPDRARARHPWPPSRILTVIRSLARRRTPLTAAELRHRHGYLVAAARRSFGSWAVAVVAAGVDPQRLRPPRLWSRERLVEAILTRALQGEPLGRRSVQTRSLAEAAAREFGSWAAALRAAGLDPDRYLNVPLGGGRRKVAPASGRTDRRPRRPGRRSPLSDAEVLAAVAARVHQRRPMTAAAARVEDRRVYRAAIRRFGTWADAVLAAASAAVTLPDGGDAGPADRSQGGPPVPA